jgi:hypothetical protein
MGGGPESSGTTTTKAITWEQLLPPWVQKGQQEFLPYLMQRAYEGGMTPEEEELLKGMARTETRAAGQGARQGLAQRMASSGLSPSSNIWTSELGNIGASEVTGISQAMANLAKLKMGAGESARQQLLTALYTPPPYATATQGSQQSSGGK